MSTENTTGIRSFTATAVALEAGVVVKLDSAGLVSVAGAEEPSIGVTREAVAASGVASVKLWSAPGTFQIQAADAITRGNQLYQAASGEVDDTGTLPLRLVAIEAATAQGDLIECVSTRGLSAAILSGDIGTVAAAGSSQTDATAIANIVTYVTASNDAKGVVLPAAAAGLTRIVYNTVAAKLLVYPATGDDFNDGSSNAAITLPNKTAAIFIAVDAATWLAIYPTDCFLVDITLADGVDLVLNTTTGSKIGTGATQKLAFFNATPVVQPSGSGQAAAAYTTQSCTNPVTSTEGNNINAGLISVLNLVNQLRTDLVALGLIKGSA